MKTQETQFVIISYKQAVAETYDYRVEIESTNFEELEEMMEEGGRYSDEGSERFHTIAYKVNDVWRDYYNGEDIEI